MTHFLKIKWLSNIKVSGLRLPPSTKAVELHILSLIHYSSLSYAKQQAIETSDSINIIHV